MILEQFRSKRGQEEIIGFMLIVIMIIVIGLALLFFMKPKQVEQTDSQIGNLVYSLMATTYEGQDLGARIDECSIGIGCDELGVGLDKVLDAAFSKSGLVVGQSLQGYSLNISGGVDYFVQKGKVTPTSRGTATLVKDNMVRLKFYY